VTGGEPLAQADFLVAWLAAPGTPLFLTPLTEPDGIRLTIGGATLDRLHAVASGVHPDVRVLPQVHKVLGIP
jgi:organic radical activating enzyme